MADKKKTETNQADETTPLADTAPVNTSGQPQDEPTVNQEGAPEEMVKAVQEAEEKGFIGGGTEKADYSQGNSAVMNGGS